MNWALLVLLQPFLRDLKNADQLGLSDNMAAGRFLDILVSWRVWQRQGFHVQSCQAEMIAVRPVTFGRLRAVESGMSHVVHGLRNIALARGFRQAAGIRIEIVRGPMRHRTNRSIMILDDKHEALGASWRIARGKRRRDVSTIAGIFLRN